jgi:hypothetical protein
MSKTFKDKPEKYNRDKSNRRPKEKRFESTKGRKKEYLKKFIEDDSEDR